MDQLVCLCQCGAEMKYEPESRRELFAHITCENPACKNFGIRQIPMYREHKWMVKK